MNFEEKTFKISEHDFKSVLSELLLDYHRPIKLTSYSGELMYVQRLYNQFDNKHYFRLSYKLSYIDINAETLAILLFKEEVQSRTGSIVKTKDGYNVTFNKFEDVRVTTLLSAKNGVSVREKILGVKSDLTSFCVSNFTMVDVAGSKYDVAIYQPGTLEVLIEFSNKEGAKHAIVLRRDDFISLGKNDNVIIRYPEFTIIRNDSIDPNNNNYFEWLKIELYGANL